MMAWWNLDPAEAEQLRVDIAEARARITLSIRKVISGAERRGFQFRAEWSADDLELRFVCSVPEHRDSPFVDCPICRAQQFLARADIQPRVIEELGK
jgi:hypothetical protein